MPAPTQLPARTPTGTQAGPTLPAYQAARGNVLVQAALDDLELLADRFDTLEEPLRQQQLALCAALDRAWATSAAYLGIRPDVDAQIGADVQRSGELAAGVRSAALSLRAAGSTAMLRATLADPAHGAAGRLAAWPQASALAGAVSELFARLPILLTAPPFVVSRRTDRAEISAAVKGSVELTYEVLSDGSARVTVGRMASGSFGPSAGASCTLTADGVDIIDVGAGARASVEIAGSAGMVWHFDDAAAAEAWLDTWRSRIVLDAATPLAAPLIGSILSTVSHVTRGKVGIGPGGADEIYEEVTLDGAAGANVDAVLLEMGARLAVSGGIGVAVRRNDDRTVTVSQSVTIDGAAEATARGVQLGTSSARGGLDAEIAVTVGLDGALQGVSLSTTKLDRSGIEPSLDSVLAPGSHAEGTRGLDELTTYVATAELDFTDPATQAALQQALGLDVTARRDQLEAARLLALHDVDALTAAAVTVSELAPEHDQQWELGCDAELIMVELPFGLAGGRTSQRTVAAAHKPAGHDELVPLDVDGRTTG